MKIVILLFYNLCDADQKLTSSHPQINRLTFTNSQSSNPKYLVKYYFLCGSSQKRENEDFSPKCVSI